MIPPIALILVPALALTGPGGPLTRLAGRAGADIALVSLLAYLTVDHAHALAGIAGSTEVAELGHAWEHGYSFSVGSSMGKYVTSDDAVTTVFHRYCVECRTGTCNASQSASGQSNTSMWTLCW